MKHTEEKFKTTVKPSNTELGCNKHSVKAYNEHIFKDQQYSITQ